MKQAHEQSGHVPKLLWLARLDIQLARLDIQLARLALFKGGASSQKVERPN